jgi:N-methylhydantoinase A
LLEHERAYGFFNPTDPVEIVNLRISAVGRLKQPSPQPSQARRRDDLRPTSERQVWLSADVAESTPVYHRTSLAPGDVVTGPAVIEQLDSTTLLFRGDTAAVDPFLNLKVELAA